MKKLKILIVEDDINAQLMLSILIEKFSKETIVTNNGIEGLEACRENEDIDLILMDIQMPKMNGYEATQKIREFNKKVLIIAQTAYGLTEDKERALALGFNYFISKPIDRKLLENIMRDEFQGPLST